MLLLFLALHYLCGTASTAPTSGAVSTTLDKADGPVLVINGADYRSTGQIGYVVLSLSEGMSNSRSHRERWTPASEASLTGDNFKADGGVKLRKDKQTTLDFSAK
jgi:hypothetical protein